ncbi:MAG: SLC13 family permease [Geminicoccaceae bacterium]
MTSDQLMVILVLAATMVQFIWNRWRYDVIAVTGLLCAVALGVVPVDRAFSGLGHPAVITVAAVLVVSQALQRSGIVDRLAIVIARKTREPKTQTALTCAVTALLSAFMNNVGALALMLPVALRNAGRIGVAPSIVLMPLAFASLLGGLVTMIGTPPNIVIATARAQSEGQAFGMFDFTVVGLVVALAGLAFIVLFGPYLLPSRQRPNAGQDRFRINAYLIEAQVVAGSALVGARIDQLERFCQNDATIMAIIRDGERLLAPSSSDRLEADDILVLEGDPLAVRPLLEQDGLVALGDQEIGDDLLTSGEIKVVEVVVMPKSAIEGRSMRLLRMHENYSINLLAMARDGRPPKARLAQVRFKIGDVLLLQGHRDTLRKVLPMLGCIPLAERGLNAPQPATSSLPLGIFTLAVISAALGIVPVQIAFVTAVLLIILTNAMPASEIYDSIEWPVIVLLAGLIPIGEALETTGATVLIAAAIGDVAGDLPLWGLLTLVMITSMLLSDLIHNTPTAVLMAPIGIGLAQTMGVSVDALLMAVAIGSASPYLTPIGHQSNTLVMGPGGYQFGDYWRLGLPLDAVILLVGIPMILWAWA